jgi:hypothetical protein
LAERLGDVAVELRHRALTVGSATATMRWESHGAAAFRDSVDETTAALRTVADLFVTAADCLRYTYGSLMQSGSRPPVPAIGSPR